MEDLETLYPDLCAEPDPEDLRRKNRNPVHLQQLSNVNVYSPVLWGPACWVLMQNTILGLPDIIPEDKFCMFRHLLALLCEFMTCVHCQKHFRKALQNMPNGPHMRQRAHLLAWWTDLQNEVNQRRHVHVLSDTEIVRTLEANAEIEAPSERPKPAMPSKKKDHTKNKHQSGGTRVPLVCAGVLGLIAGTAALVHLTRRRKSSKK